LSNRNPQGVRHGLRNVSQSTLPALS
jgi:hypothetical protein